MSFIEEALMKFARKILEGVINEITKAINRVQNEVISEASKFLSSVTDAVWKGEDADAFKAEVAKMILPGLNDMTAMGKKLIGGFEQAADVIQKADQRVDQIVGDLNSLFGKIY